jgi:uncharacterized protein
VAIGVLSDTHGQLYPRVVESLRGVDHIIHAGDIGAPQVLTALRQIAPVTAVRGNCDLEAWAADLPPRTELTLGGARILVGHMVQRQRAAAPEDRLQDVPDFAVIVFGHSHVAAIEEREGVLYLNPGSAGPRRFGRPRTVARLEIAPAGGSESEPLPGARPQIAAEILTVDA